MAKSKNKDEEKESKETSSNNSVESILKKYGNVFTSCTNLLDKKRIVFPVSPAIDIALGGGIPEGSFVSISGPAGCGKSTTVLQIVANAQRDEFNVKGETRKVFYCDVEHRLKPMNLRGIDGLKVDKMDHIHSVENKILSAQEFLDIGEALVKDPKHRGCILVMDSSSALCPSDELTAGTNGSIRTTQPKILSHWCKKMASPMKVMDATIIFIQHLITNTSGYGEKWLTDGGEKIKYHLDVKLMTKNKPEGWDENDVRVGQKIEWEIIKSANGQPSNASSYLRYGHGLDSLQENIVLAVDFGIINLKGAWYSFELNGETQKFQGEAKLYQGLVDNPVYKTHIESEVKKLII